MISFIPARGGSKGIPLKNLQKVGDKPLVVRAIEAGQIATGKSIVSTDNFDIWELAKSQGAYPHIRPKAISGDTATIKQALNYTINHLQIEDDILVLLPTYPFREKRDLELFLNFWLDHRETADSCLCAIPVKKDHPMLCFEQIEDYRGLPIMGQAQYTRQKRLPVSRVCHYMAVIKSCKLRFLDDGLWNRSTVFYQLDTEPIDIDSPEDLENANELVETGLYV